MSRKGVDKGIAEWQRQTRSGRRTNKSTTTTAANNTLGMNEGKKRKGKSNFFIYNPACISVYYPVWLSERTIFFVRLPPDEPPRRKMENEPGKEGDGGSEGFVFCFIRFPFSVTFEIGYCFVRSGRISRFCPFCIWKYCLLAYSRRKSRIYEDFSALAIPFFVCLFRRLFFPR